MTAPETWKRHEREIARFFGAERSPAGSNGRPDRTASDSTHDALFIEVKYRDVHATRTLWEATKVKAKKERRGPVVLGLADRGRKGPLITIHLDDFDAVAAQRAKVLAREGQG